jgi:hypothetical protein
MPRPGGYYAALAYSLPGFVIPTNFGPAADVQVSGGTGTFANVGPAQTVTVNEDGAWCFAILGIGSLVFTNAPTTCTLQMVLDGGAAGAILIPTSLLTVNGNQAMPIIIFNANGGAYEPRGAHTLQLQIAQTGGGTSTATFKLGPTGLWATAFKVQD